MEFEEYLLKKKKSLQEKIYAFSKNDLYKSQMRLLNEIIKRYKETNK